MNDKTWLTILALALAGCGSQSPAPQAPSAQSQPGETRPESLEGEAQDRGAPPVNRAWTPTDYVAFYEYLSKLPRESLPRATKSETRELFMKMIDSIEQPMFTNADIPLMTRLAAAMQMVSAVNNTMLKYTQTHNSGTDYSTELAYLMGMSLVTNRQLLLLAEEFTPTLDPNDGDYEMRMQGAKTMKGGMATVVSGAIITLQETKVYSDDERLILVDYFVVETPKILPRLDAGPRRELELRIDSLANSERHTEIRDRLQRLSKTLQDSATERE